MNMSAEAYTQYQKTAVESIPPAKLLIMLYDGAIRFINQAVDAIKQQDINRAHQQIIKTETIIVELISTLNMDYEVSKNLFELYEFYYNQLVEANLKKDPIILNQVKEALTELRDTWQQAAQIVNNSQTKPKNTVSYPGAAQTKSSPSVNQHFSIKG